MRGRNLPPGASGRAPVPDMGTGARPVHRSLASSARHSYL